MGARTSDAMLKARALIEAGSTPYAAAKATGISQSAITKSKWNRQRLVDLAKTQDEKKPV